MKTRLLTIGLCLFVASCASPTSPASSSGSVTYEITGTATHVSVTYQNSTGGTSQTGASLPFSYFRLARSGDFLYISAQIDRSPDSGSISVKIQKDGRLLDSASAFGFPNIATASGSY